MDFKQFAVCVKWNSMLCIWWCTMKQYAECLMYHEVFCWVSIVPWSKCWVYEVQWGNMLSIWCTRKQSGEYMLYHEAKCWTSHIKWSNLLSISCKIKITELYLLGIRKNNLLGFLLKRFVMLCSVTIEAANGVYDRVKQLVFFLSVL